MKVNLIIFQFLLTLIIVNAEIDPSWVHPHAWKTADPGNGVAPYTGKSACGPEDKAVAIFYKKLVRNIFNRNQMTFNEISNQYERSVQFRITEEQLERLHTTEDLYALDAVVSQILHGSKTSALTENFGRISGVFRTIFQGVWGSPELRFIFVTACVIMAISYIAMKNDYGWIKIIFLSILAMIIFGYIHTYYECNRELEVEELLKLIEANDPCEEHLKEKERSWIWNLFARSKKQECTDHIKNSHKTKLPFCRPDKVLLIYLNDIAFRQIEALLTTTGKAFQNSYGNIGIIPTTVGFVILIYMLRVLYVPMMQYFFEYLKHVSLPGSQPQQHQPAPIAAEPRINNLIDEILVKLLSIRQNSPTNSALESSGVEVLETIRNKDNNRSLEDVPGPSNVKAEKPLKVDEIIEDDDEWETVVKHSDSKTDISKFEDTDASDQKSKHDNIGDKTKVS